MGHPDNPQFSIEQDLDDSWLMQLRVMESATNQSLFFDAVNHPSVLENLDRPPFQARLRESLRRLALPELNANRFRVATMLALLKGPLLDIDVREALGLSGEPPDPTQVDSQLIVPTLLPPAAPDRFWHNLCADAEFFLERTIKRHKPEYPLHFFQPGLVGKSEGVVAGLCYETTEFASGAIFVEGVWYTLRSTEVAQRVLRLNELREAEQKGHRAKLIGLKMRETFSKAGTEYVMDGPDTVKWTRFPSTWQPSTGFAPAQNIGTEYYSTAEMRRFLAGEITTQELYEQHGAKTPIFKDPDRT